MQVRARGLGVALESALLLGCFTLAGLVRFGGDYVALLDHPAIIPKAVLSVAALQLCMFYGELYDLRGFRRRLELFLGLGQCVVATGIALTVVSFGVRDVALGRVLLVTYLTLAWGALLGWRLLLAWTLGEAALGERILILGTGAAARRVATELIENRSVGHRIIGFLSEHPAEVGRKLVNPSVIGVLDDVKRLADERRASLIVVAQEDRRQRLPMEALLRCRLDGVRVIEAASVFEELIGRIVLKDLRPSWLIFSPGFQRPRLLRNAKRLGEILLSSCILILGAPLMAFAAILVRMDGPGPILYRQPRVGENGREFVLLKFRTMREDAEHTSGPVWAAAQGDPRITRLGRFLRKLRLDELPQVWNVLRGDMSFVGPRPERPHFVEKLRKVIPYYDQRHSVKPGITGWAQVKFSYGSTLEDAEEKLEYDLFYVKHMSPLLDLGIVLETLKVMLLGRGAR